MLVYPSRVYTLKVKADRNNDEKEGYVNKTVVTNRWMFTTRNYKSTGQNLQRLNIHERGSWGRLRCHWVAHCNQSGPEYLRQYNDQTTRWTTGWVVGQQGQAQRLHRYHTSWSVFATTFRTTGLCGPCASYLVPLASSPLAENNARY